MGKDTVKEMTQAEREQLFEESEREDFDTRYEKYIKKKRLEKENALRSPNGMIILKQNLTFRKAFDEMLKGKKISRPCFKGYWFMDHESKVVIHDRHDNELKEGDITNTVTNTLANDWEVIE